MDYLLFVDTNVLLDFYRARTDASLHLLDRIDEIHDKIITSYQVEMEFKKNRQKVILDSLRALKRSNDNPAVPAFFKQAKAMRAIKKSEKSIARQFKNLRGRTEKLLANPTTNDPVYKPIQRLFRDDTQFNLSREKRIRYKIRRLAWKRFILGYPPRKDSDNSTGDAVNWEWIVECAQVSGRNIIIASRDSDYGVTVEGTSYLNDWLIQEFRARVSKRRQIILTQSVAEALKLMTVDVTDEEVQEERRLIDQEGQRALDITLPADFISNYRELQTRIAEIARKLREQWEIEVLPDGEKMGKSMDDGVDG